MIHKRLILQLTRGQIKSLKNHYHELIQYMEKGFPLKAKVLENLKKTLSGIVNASPQWQEVLKGIDESGEFFCLHLLHHDNEILNMPWTMAVDKISQKSLGNINQLYLTKGITGYFKEKPAGLAKAAAPLKVLIMIASPQDDQWKNRLSYEEEEFEILKAFEPLMRTGLVEIDFTEDGSLEALKRKLLTNRYHVLHVSGHAAFNKKKNTGYLQLEDPVDLKTVQVNGEDFARGVNCNHQYRVPMVIMASCQTARGNSEQGLRGITNQLLKKEVPVVISMGMSIIDRYAILFSARLYNRMAEKQSIFMAFKDAVNFIKEKEFDDQLNAHISSPVPLQWVIPNLYLSRELEGVVDWEVRTENLSLPSNRYIFEKDRLLLKHEKDYLFIGRRKEKPGILQPFFNKKPILLKGQGGIGKTAMAEHLVQRLMVKDLKTVPFVFNEKLKTIKDILDALQDFLVRQQRKVGVIAEVNKYEKGMEKFLYLLSEVEKEFRPVFVFDKLENFQVEWGKEFSEEFSDIKEVIDYLCDIEEFHVILTCRYPVPDVKNFEEFDLNQVEVNDFYKKCLYLDVGHINTYLQEAAVEKVNSGLPSPGLLPFIDIAKLLHETFGGNYRALEFFNELLRQNPGKIKDSLYSIEAFRGSSKKVRNEVSQRMGQNLLFSQLMSLLEPPQQWVLELLSHFRIPVQLLALQLQMQEQDRVVSVDLSKMTEDLHRLTLIEISFDQEIRVADYYVTAIVKYLLADYEKTESPYSFSHKQAGVYYYNYFCNINTETAAAEEAFYHFYQVGDKEKIRELGDWLSNFYYKNFKYHKLFYYARRVYQLLGDETEWEILIHLGMIYKLRGEYEEALSFYRKGLARSQRIRNKSREAETLNNISEVYVARNDYDDALEYMEQSLRINREIEDKAGEAAALNNFSQVHYAFGDYDTALKYMGKCLKIFREIGDKSREGTLLNNISQVYSTRGDYDTAVKYMEQDLEICREIGDKAGEGKVLNNIGRIYKVRGDYDTALKYYEQSLIISQELGDKAGEGKSLNNLGTTFLVRRDYDTALKYFKKSLEISREKGYRDLEARNLNNISLVHSHRSDYDTALKYLEKSLKIIREIGDKQGEANALFNLAQVYFNENVNQKEKGFACIKRVIEMNTYLKDSHLTDGLKDMGFG